MTTPAPKPPREPLHPQVERFIQHARPEMSTEEVAYILGDSASSVRRACGLGKIEAIAPNSRGADIRRAFRITEQSLLIYIVRTSTPPRDALMRSIARALPQYVALANDIAQQADRSTASTPPNLTKTTLKAAHHIDQPELFEALNA